MKLDCICMKHFVWLCFRHKNVQVRKVTAQFLLTVVQRMGPGRILSGVKDITDRIIPAIAQFSMDSTQDTRLVNNQMIYEGFFFRYIFCNFLVTLQASRA